MSAGAGFDTFVSVVVPLRNAAAHVEATLAEIDAVVGKVFRHCEIVLVDDGSRDQTVPIIQRIQKQMKNVQLYCLHPQYGFDIALIAGIDNSIGDYVITLNVETDPVAMIPQLWAKAQEGYELVCGVDARQLREGNYRSWLKRLYYRVLTAMTGLVIPPGTSGACLYSRRVVSYITQNRDRHLLLKILPFFISNRVATVEYSALRGSSGFGRRNAWGNITRGVTILLGSSIRPLRLLTLTAFLASSGSLLFAVYVVAVALFKRRVVEGWITLALPMAVMFFFVSLILGMLSEYIYILAQQSGNRPTYLVAHESLSSVLDIQQKLNVVEGSGHFASLPAEERQRNGDASSGQ